MGFSLVYEDWLLKGDYSKSKYALTSTLISVIVRMPRMVRRLESA